MNHACQNVDTLPHPGDRGHTVIEAFSLILVLSTVILGHASANEVHGTFMEWHKTVMTFKGPDVSESATPNPFRDYRLDVTLKGPSGQTRKLPGYYAADGRAAQTSANSGHVWQVRFVPDQAGTWRYRASFVTGKDVALQLTGGKSAGYCDGDTGSFHVAPSDKDAPNPRAKGALRYTGAHYLQFAGTEDYFLKGGADSPENFLAYGDIDNTYDADAGSGSYSHIGGFLHQYAPHVKDWRPGDPTWQYGKGKGIIGALNYLASKGMNSVYFLTYNLDGGDGRDTWMWTDVNERERFDCSKLDQWEIIFDHMDQLGIMLHVVTQETENDHNLGGSAGLNPIRRLYYRELVARFSHHLALIWNLGEENNTPDADRKEIAALIHTLDPYDHPITVHTHNDQALKFYNGILGDKGFEATSIQGHMDRYNREATLLRQRSADTGRKWVIFGDEQAAASHGVVPDANDPTHDIPRKEGLWGNLMGGGSGVEWYFGHQFPHMDINCEDWRSRDIMWDQTRHALTFFHKYLDFWNMMPANRLTSTEDNCCFVQEGRAYVIYLKNGGSTQLDLKANKGPFEVHWYNPRTGGDLVRGTVSKISGPGKVSIGTSKVDPDKDWAVLIRKLTL